MAALRPGAFARLVLLPLLAGAVREADRLAGQLSEQLSVNQTSDDAADRWSWGHSTVAVPSLEGWSTGTPGAKGSRAQEHMLVPKMMVPQGKWWEMLVVEQKRLVETHEYDWDLDKVDGKPTEQMVASVRGKIFKNMFNLFRTVHVSNDKGTERFVIQSQTLKKFKFLHALARHSYRILSPDKSQVFFTITKDHWGTGWFFKQREWRIYRGDTDEEVYYVLESGDGHKEKWWFYHSEAHQRTGAQWVAEIQQVYNSGAGKRGIWRHLYPDEFEVTIKGGEDTALIMTTSTILDIVQDKKDR